MRGWRIVLWLGSLFLTIQAQSAAPTNAAPGTAPLPAPTAGPAVVAPVAVAPNPPAAKTPAATTEGLSATAELATFDAAVRDFDAGLYERAARSFSAFEFAFPDSLRKADAILRRAFAEAASHTNAAVSAERLIEFSRVHPASPLALNALIRASRTVLQQGRTDVVIKLLNPGQGPVAIAMAAGNRRPELVAAFQMRAEAALAAGQPAIAIEALEKTAPWVGTGPPETAFERLRLLNQAHLAAGNAASAVTAAESLKRLTESGPLTNRHPESVSILAGALLRSGNRARATGVFAENLAPGTPLPLFREATLQVAESDRRGGRLVAARTRLETYLAAHPGDPQMEGIRWSLAQTLFALYQATRAASTNDTSLLVLTESHLAAALTNHTTDLRGDLQLLRGWCLWEGGVGTNPLVEAGEAFTEAAALLPRSAAQAVARFKLADVQFRQGQPAAALTNYLAVAENYRGVGDVEAQYATLAWQQAVAAAIAATNFPAAQRAIEQLMVRDPRAEATARGLLALTDEYARHGTPLQGRELLEQFVARFPDSPMRAEVELSIADALRREELWARALNHYERWLAAHQTQTNRIRAEFGRALVLASSGGTTNAVEQFLQLANRYPNSPLAQTALIWLGNHYFQQGRFGQAEQAYTSVLTNAVAKNLDPTTRAQARLSAAQAAMAWKQYPRAHERLRELLNDKGTPADFLPEAYLTFGQSLMQAPPIDTNAPLSAVTDALDAFKAATTFTESPLVPEAWLAMGECHRQLAASNPASYAIARELYQRALDPKLAIEPSVRARAKIGLGLVALQQATGRPAVEATVLENEALEHFLDVALGKITAITGPLEASVLKDAGHEAGLLMEARGRIKEADSLYERLASELPAMRAYWDARRDKLKRN